MSINLLKQQRASGFRHLRFVPSLEKRFRTERNLAMKERARLVTASALVLSLLYALLDVSMLPQALAQQTVAVRIFFICPVLGFIFWLSYRPIDPALFVPFYAAAYLAGGLSIIAIIAQARQLNVPVPYDGILLTLMFGYVVMGLPFRTVSVCSPVIILAYLAMEVALGTDSALLLANSVFLLTANMVGMVGSWLSEYRQRAHFLDRQMLDESRRSAEQESVRKSHLITVASHDLRQPLNVISLMLENLSPDDLPPSQQPLVSKLKTSVAHFGGLLASVLDISRIREGMVISEPRALDSRQVLRQLIDTCIDDAVDRNIHLTATPGSGRSGVWADPQLLHRILQNLVVNGLEHSDGRSIVLRTRKRRNRIRFEVNDDGSGISENKRMKVFEPFFRAEASSQPHPGLGLGLAIVRELTELMGGDCGVTSKPNKGSCFWVELPAVELLAPARNSASPFPADQGQELRLLVVEDHRETLQWVCETLRQWGYQAIGVATADEAIDYGRQSRVDLLISKRELSNLTGVALFEHLRTLQPLCGGVIITADPSIGQGHDRDRNLWVLHKPLAPMRLRAAIMQLTRPRASSPEGPGTRESAR